MNILITGGGGFIGAHLVRQLLASEQHHVINLDKISYATNQSALDEFKTHKNYDFTHTNLENQKDVRDIFRKYQPDAVMHLAAESHVDRSIDGPSEFIQSNIVGTFNLLQAALEYYTSRPELKDSFRFLHVSTDEVYGSLSQGDRQSVEDDAYHPRSPYSASKAASDHLARAWEHTYGLPVIVTNCSNNYGPGQFPEKLIPLMCIKGLHEEKLPVYGTGENIRDWLYVTDHAAALMSVLQNGTIGETYNIGGNTERTNLEIVNLLCEILDELVPPKTVQSRKELITFVTDRPGHDFRYALNTSKIKNELGWQPKHSFEQGLKDTVKWYLDHQDWWKEIQKKSYAQERLGTTK